MGVTPAVDKQHDLLPFLQPVLHQLLQPAAENGLVALLQLPAQVHDLRSGQGAVRFGPLL